MVFAFFTACAAAMMSFILFHAARPERQRIAIPVHDDPVHDEDARRHSR